LTLPINIITGPTDFQIRKINNFLRYEHTYYGELRKIIRNLYELYLSKDCSLIEINPLIQNKSGEILALDAKITFDEDALFRQNLIKELRDLSQENPVEIETAKLGIKYIQLQGSVGCIVNGAGLAMATMDVINVSGLKPANFLDIGGGADENKVSEAMLAVLSDQNVEVVLINLFGGILRCDVAARGFLSALDKYNKKAPELIIRMLGTNSDKGKEILSASKYNISFADNLNEISKILITKR
jgi:succinyl-CoA synthetase beta subunit